MRKPKEGFNLADYSKEAILAVIFDQGLFIHLKRQDIELAEKKVKWEKAESKVDEISKEMEKVNNLDDVESFCKYAKLRERWFTAWDKSRKLWDEYQKAFDKRYKMSKEVGL